MRPLDVRPMKPTYDPGYPSFLEVDDWEELVCLSSRRIFDPATLLFAGILGGAFFVSAAGASAPEVEPTKVKPPPMESPLKASNPKAVEIAQKALAEVQTTGGYYKTHTISQREVVKSNPQVTVPHIRIFYGNSYLGVFDTKRAKQATLAMFEAYGVKLQPNQAFNKGGVQFQADGYNAEKKIGFEIMLPDKALGLSRPKPTDAPPPPAQALDEKEVKALGEMVAAKKESLFVAPAELYPNMDGDQYTPLRSYLQSVLDYLEWLKQQGRI